jgi:hypothetical protein
VIAVAWNGREQTGVTGAGVQQAETIHEEDLVRPAIDADGQPTWVPAGEVVWHEIVHWRDAPDAHREGRQTA